MKTTKHIMFNVSGMVLMLAGFIFGLLVFIYFSIPFLKSMGPNPNRLVVIFVVLPLMVAVAGLFAYLGIAVSMIVWKPFLNTEQAREYIFEPVTPRSEITKVFSVLFVRPYYRLASLVYPKVQGQFE
jgi:ABC-type lipoprotein release transport system permease subunit